MIFMTLFVLSTSNVVLADEAPADETTTEEPKKESADC